MDILHTQYCCLYYILFICYHATMFYVLNRCFSKKMWCCKLIHRSSTKCCPEAQKFGFLYCIYVHINLNASLNRDQKEHWNVHQFRMLTGIVMYSNTHSDLIPLHLCLHLLPWFVQNFTYSASFPHFPGNKSVSMEQIYWF